jgi:hypothetical protein
MRLARTLARFHQIHGDRRDAGVLGGDNRQHPVTDCAIVCHLTVNPCCKPEESGAATIDGRTADLEKPYEATRAEACCRRQTRLGPLGLPILTTPLTKRHDLRYMLVGRRCKLRARPQREPYLPLVDQASQPQPLQYPRLLPGGQRHHVGVPLDASAAVHVDVTRL